MENRIPSIIEIGNVLVSSDIFTVKFCCDLDICKGICCVEGNAGAPVKIDELLGIEEAVDVVWSNLSASAQSVLDKQGVAYIDPEADLVTSIVAGKDCVFTCYQGDTCFCALEKAYREGKTAFCKPISCALYPIREKKITDEIVGLNYHRWKICECALEKGKALNLPLYQFLKEPLTRRFGAEWYYELCLIAQELKAQALIE